MALQKSELLLNETARKAKVGGWEIDLTGQTLTWTEETFRIHELPLSQQPNIAEAIGFYHPDDQDMVAAAVQQQKLAQEKAKRGRRSVTKKG